MTHYTYLGNLRAFSRKGVGSEATWWNGQPHGDPVLPVTSQQRTAGERVCAQPGADSNFRMELNDPSARSSMAKGKGLDDLLSGLLQMLRSLSLTGIFDFLPVAEDHQAHDVGAIAEVPVDASLDGLVNFVQ